MWTHYAADHTGFVLGFDQSHPIFDHRLTSNDETGYLRKVAYLETLPRTPLYLYDSSPHPLLGRSLSDHLWLIKSPDWAYEREWRMLILLVHASKRVKAEPYDICLFRFPFSAVTEIILGARCNSATRKAVVSSVSTQRSLAHVKLYQASLNEESYAISISPA